MAALATAFTIFAGIIALLAAAIHFFGVPAEWKEAAEKKLIQETGENQASAILKDRLARLPESDKATAEQLQNGIGKLTGGDLKNPLGSLLGGK